MYVIDGVRAMTSDSADILRICLLGDFEKFPNHHDIERAKKSKYFRKFGTYTRAVLFHPSGSHSMKIAHMKALHGWVVKQCE